jgi:GDPmannose 4,6-dehydratase
MPRALITGITGQAGSHLAELLLEKNYEVHGLIRRSSSSEGATWRIDPILPRLHLHEGDMCDGGSLTRVVHDVKPHEIYNLAAQSHVRVSYEEPEYTADAVAMGTLRLLEAVRLFGYRTRVYQASTSEMFGASPPPQNEATPFHPRSPYGVAKLAAHWHAINHRESYNLHASTGLMFNCEGPRRGEQFVTRKTTLAVARIKLGLQDKLTLGNLDAERDWGYAGDYVRAMWLILQADAPDDYVICSGETRPVREFVARAFRAADLNWEDHVVYDSRLHRPAEVHALRGDASKARKKLGWEPKVGFDELVEMMVDADMDRVRRQGR